MNPAKRSRSGIPFQHSLVVFLSLPFPPAFAMQYSFDCSSLPATSGRPPSRPLLPAPCHISGMTVSTTLAIPHYSRTKCCLIPFSPAFLPATISILPFFFIPPSCHTSFRTVRPICAVCAIWRQNSSSTPSSCSNHTVSANLAFHYVPIRSNKISDHRHFSLSMFDVSQLRLLILQILLILSDPH